jgi:hypothetical protein
MTDTAKQTVVQATGTTPSPRVAALLEKTRLSCGRLIFALDATASREPAWDLAAQLQAAMFQEAAKVGGLEVQLVWYRGPDECSHTAWTTDTAELAAQMSRIKCASGATKIARVLEHIRAEHQREKVAAAIFISDAVEEPPSELYSAAANLGVPVFLFQEGDGLVMYFDQRGEFVQEHPRATVEQVFREIARLSNGAYARFDAGAAAKLGELLAAVAAFAVGGTKALANQQTDSARKLLSLTVSQISVSVSEPRSMGTAIASWRERPPISVALLQSS